MSEIETIVFENSDVLVSSAAAMIASRLKDLSISGDEFHIAITGGTVGTRTLESLAKQTQQTDLSRLHIWWVDERYVTRDSPDRNELQARKAWLSSSTIPEINIHAFQSSEYGTIEEAAADFARAIEQHRPKFELVLLGMGEDGHVASLFPGARAEATGNWVAVEKNSPKPPSERLSLSLTALNSAEEVIFLVSGIEKARAVGDVFSGNRELPAANVSGKQSTIWLLDKDAASKIISS
jgi:6-phosphogluconolactonase